MLLALGSFIFEIDNLLFDQIRRRRSWRHPSGDRVGARPSSQYAGPGDDSINIKGLVADGQLGKAAAIAELAAMADAGGAYPLVDADGNVMGAFVIESLDEDLKHWHPSGVPMVIDFSLDLKRVDDDEAEPFVAGEPIQ